jgi:hypothetical protein
VAAPDRGHRSGGSPGRGAPAGLERVLAINRDAFRATAMHGAFTAVLDVTAAVAEADGRLSLLINHKAATA